MKANLFIPVFNQVAANATQRFSFLRWRSDPRYGIRITWQKVGQIWPIYRVDACRLVPAYYFDFPVGNGATDNGTIAPLRYTRFDAGKYVEYTIPASGAGIDTLIYTVRAVVGGGLMSVLVNGVDSGVNLDSSFTTTATLERSVTLPVALQAGDVLRLVADSSSARLMSVIGYAANGTPTADNAVTAQGALTEIVYHGSSVELAYNIKGGAQANFAFVGGSNHQGGGTFGFQQQTAESITVDGQASALALGYTSGQVIGIQRTSNLRDQGDALTYGQMVEQYQLRGHRLEYSSALTAAIEIIAGVTYSPMLPAMATAQQAVCGREPMDLTTASGHVSFAGKAPSLAIWGGQANCSLRMDCVSASTPWSEVFIIGDAFSRKGYFSVGGPRSIPADSVLRTGWALTVDHEARWRGSRGILGSHHIG